MAFSHGSAAVVKLDNSGGSITDITAYVDSGEMNRMRDKAETTVLGLTSKTYIQGLLDCTFSIKGKFDATIDGYLEAALTQTSGSTKSVEYLPQGTGTGNIKYTFEVICTGYTTPFDVGGELTMSAQFQCTGGVTRTVL